MPDHSKVNEIKDACRPHGPGISRKELSMTTFKCEEMMCDHCVSRINTALKEAGLDHKVDLGTKTVTVLGDETSSAKAAEVLDDLGFTPVKL